MIIDCQVHAYEANTPKRPWHSVPNWPPHVTGDEMVVEMDKVGVDGAIFISAFGLYQYDASYAVEVQKAHPKKFAIVKPVNPPAVLPVVLYVHGGGWILGNAGTHDRLVRELAVGAQAAVAFVEYDRSPEACHPVAIEQDLLKLLPAAERVVFTHRVIDHGRAVCVARTPRCAACSLAELCPSAAA